MSLIEKAIDEGKALACIILYPVGCIKWLTLYRSEKNWRFLILLAYGLITAVFSLDALVNGWFVNRNPNSLTVLLICAISYGIGLFAFVIMSWHKMKRESIEGTKKTAQGA